MRKQGRRRDEMKKEEMRAAQKKLGEETDVMRGKEPRGGLAQRSLPVRWRRERKRGMEKETDGVRDAWRRRPRNVSHKKGEGDGEGRWQADEMDKREERKETERHRRAEGEDEEEKMLTKQTEPECISIKPLRSGVAPQPYWANGKCVPSGTVWASLCVLRMGREQNKSVTVYAINRLYDFSTLRPPVLKGGC